MKKTALLVFVLACIAIVVLALIFSKNIPVNSSVARTTPTPNQKPTSAPSIETIASDLDIPWSIVFLATNDLLVTERTGNLLEIKNGKKQVVGHINVKTGNDSEGGLLGLALDPNFKTNNFIYLYYTYAFDGNNSLNRVVKYKFTGGKISNPQILIDLIPASKFHNGGRIKFGPDGYLYVTIGDAEVPSHAQDKTSLSGKILRITTTGQAAPGNPFGTLIYSYGHRNPQGLAWDTNGKLWETEHGRSNPTGFDELNIIEPGKNYGWPLVQGDQTQAGMVTPIINSGPNTTWAPAGAIYLRGSIFFGGLKGQALYEYNISNKKLTEHLKNQYGRIRDVELGPDGFIYITTSNRDGRGTTGAGDDKIVKINPQGI